MSESHGLSKTFNLDSGRFPNYISVSRSIAVVSNLLNTADLALFKHNLDLTDWGLTTCRMNWVGKNASTPPT